MSALNLPADAMEAVVAKAILDQITPEVREDIIVQAIAKLIETPPKPGGYGPTPPTPLRAAFENAVGSQLNKTVRQLIEDDPKVQEQLTAVVSPVLMEIAEGNWDGLPEAIGSAVGEWIQKRGR